jgi:hypothetical protein
LLAALGHAAEEFLHVLEPFLYRPSLGLLAQPLAAQHLFEVGAPFRLRVTSSDCSERGAKCNWRVNPRRFAA